MEILKVASHSNPRSISGAIVAALEQDGVVEIHAIGAGAVNQTVKAIAIACRMTEEGGCSSIRAIPGFIDLDIDGEQRTAIRFIVEK